MFAELICYENVYLWLFLLKIFYVDRLARNPVCWGIWPRVKVWCNDELRKVINEDHQRTGSDFGSIKV